MRERILRVYRNLVVLTLAVFAASESTAFAQVTNLTSPPFGTSTAGGSGGTPTGPTINPGATGFGTNNMVTPHRPLNPYGGTGAGSGGIVTSYGSRVMSDPAWSSSTHRVPSTKRMAKRSARKHYAVHRTAR